MSKNTIVDIPANEWVEVTDNDVSGIAIVNLSTVSSRSVLITATDGSDPGSDPAHIPLGVGKGVEASMELSDLFPGVSNPQRVFVMAPGAPGRVSVSHA